MMGRRQYLMLLATLVLASAHAGDLHEARVFVRELASPESQQTRSVSGDDGHPDVMALNIHTEDERQLTNFLLARNRAAENSFSIVAANNEFRTIQPGELKGPALYVDSRLGGVFAATTDEDGQREFEGSFNHAGQRYMMSRETKDEARKRGSLNSGRAYVLKRLSSPSTEEDDDVDIYDDELEEPEDAGDERMFSSKRGLDKRANGNYNVELGIYLDYSVYSYWLQKKGGHAAAMEAINYKFSYSVAGMQLVYESIVKNRDGFSLTPWIATLVVNTDSSQSPIRMIDSSLTTRDPKTQTVEVSNILSYFKTNRQWVESVGLQPGFFGGQVDATMFWSGYDLTDGGRDYTLGQAYTGSACAGHSFSAVEEVGFDTWMSAAHELGHLLGARHDEDSKHPGTMRCPRNNQNVMRPGTNIINGPTPSTNHITFSSCSIEFISNYIDRLTQNNYNCLENAGRNGFTVVRVSPEPGALYSADDQCRMMFGLNIGEGGCSRYNDANMCWKGLRCQVGNQCSRRYRPADGTPCGGGKTCYHGYCQ